eukprot:7408543-Heterocapsa_arctica.AAC.1
MVPCREVHRTGEWLHREVHRIGGSSIARAKGEQLKIVSGGLRALVSTRRPENEKGSLAFL